MSGGPVFDGEGRMIGIVSSSPSGEGEGRPFGLSIWPLAPVEFFPEWPAALYPGPTG
jgi:hypothetical protein